MLSNIRRLLALFFVIFAVIIPSTQAGDVLDFLPETQLARSSQLIADATLSILFQGAQGLAEFSDCLENALTGEIEDHVLTDINGQFRTRDESLEVALNAFCTGVIVSASNTQVVPILEGEKVPFVPGELRLPGDEEASIDGTKQSVRAAIASITPVDFFIELHLGVTAAIGRTEPLFDGDPCRLLREWAMSGVTIELRRLAFEVLSIDQSGSDSSDSRESTCSFRHFDPVQTLRADAEAGDLDAAVSLARYWAAQSVSLRYTFDEEGEILINEDTTLEEVQSEIERFELLILENTGRFPLLTMAASFPLEILYSLESDFIENQDEELP